jgi:2-dehydropantoate 2-reductase
MKVLIIGAGVIGSVYAARLTEAGIDITLLARGKRLKDIKKHGVVLKHFFTGEETQTPVKIIEKLKQDDDFDLVIVIIRGDQQQEVLKLLEPCKKIKTFLFVGNNPRDPYNLIKVLGKDRVMLGFGGVAGFRDDYKICYADSDIKGKKKMHFCFGELDGGKTECCKQISALFNKAGYPVWIFKDVVSWLKCHMIIIMPIMGILSISGWTQDEVISDVKTIGLGVKAFKELVHAFRKNSIPIIPKRFILLSLLPDFILTWIFRKFLGSKAAQIGIFGHTKGSSGKTEMHSLSVEVNSIVKTAHMDTPAWDRIYKAIRSSN